MGLSSFFNTVFGHKDRRDEDGNTRLFCAARDGNQRVVKDLLAKGADPNAVNAHGLTALHAAAYWGEKEITQMLLAAGANPRAATDKGWSVLHSCALSAGLKGRTDVMKILIEKGADLYKKDKHDWTPLDYARLWDEDRRDDLRKLLKSQMDNEGGQPDMLRLGIKKPSTPHDDRPKKPQAAKKPPAKTIDDTRRPKLVWQM